jgi:hypothetical protein
MGIPNFWNDEPDQPPAPISLTKAAGDAIRLEVQAFYRSPNTRPGVLSYHFRFIDDA